MTERKTGLAVGKRVEVNDTTAPVGDSLGHVATSVAIDITGSKLTNIQTAETVLTVCDQFLSGEIDHRQFLKLLQIIAHDNLGRVPGSFGPLSVGNMEKLNPDLYQADKSAETSDLNSAIEKLSLEIMHCYDRIHAIEMDVTRGLKPTVDLRGANHDHDIKISSVRDYIQTVHDEAMRVVTVFFEQYNDSSNAVSKYRKEHPRLKQSVSIVLGEGSVEDSVVELERLEKEANLVRTKIVELKPDILRLKQLLERGNFILTDDDIKAIDRLVGAIVEYRRSCAQEELGGLWKAINVLGAEKQGKLTGLNELENTQTLDGANILARLRDSAEQLRNRLTVYLYNKNK